MTARRAWSLQGRLRRLILGVLASVWLASAVATWVDARHELDELLDAHLAQAAAILVARQAHEAVEHGDLDPPLLHRYASRVAFQVFHEGRLALRSANAPAAPMLAGVQGNASTTMTMTTATATATNGDVDSGARAAPVPAGFATASIGGRPWRLFSTGRTEDDLVVVVGEQSDSREALLLAVLRGTLAPPLLALPLLLAGVWWAVARGLSPWRALLAQLRQRSPDALQPLRVGAPAVAEIEPVVDELNRLFEQIGRLRALERRFTADAAHELRTPIAAIRTQAQVALREPDEARRAHALRATLAGCDRSARLVEQLLTLSRLESGEPRPREPVDVARLVRDVAADLAPRALAASQRMAVDVAGAGTDEADPMDWTSPSDPVLLGMLVRNLVDNAVRYAGPGAAIEAVVRRDAGTGGVVVAIDDGGPGLAADAIARLGERFVRGHPGDGGGSGLGWSIVRRLAEVLAVDIDVGRSRLGGLGVTLRLPAPEKAPQDEDVR